MNPRPGDEPAVSEEQRAQWEMEIRAGREPWTPPVRSRRRFGRILDLLESIVRATGDRPHG